MTDSCRVNRRDQELFDRREALRRGAGAALGGVLGSLLISSCRAPQVYRDFPAGSPTGYLVDPRYCTRCGDCLRVCRCDAVGGYTFNETDKKKSPARNEEESDKHQCWIYIDKCCACGRCYRVCDVDAIIPCYGEDKKPAKEIPEWKAGMKWGNLKSPNAAPGCCTAGMNADK
jgi:ferredoxin